MTSIQKQIGRFYRLFTYRIGTNGDPDLIELEDGKVTINGVIYTAGAAPFYGCRAWVNFDGTTAANQAATYSRTGTTVTVTLAGHGYLAGHVVYCNFTSGGALDGTYTITGVPTADTFTLTTAASGTIAAGSTLELNRRAIRASGNVHSISYLAAGYLAMNFLKAMPDANYAVAGAVNREALANAGVHVPNSFATVVYTFYTQNTASGDVNGRYQSVAIFR